MGKLFRAMLLAICAAAFWPGHALADGGVCPRPAAGSEVAPPPDLYSENGVLKLAFTYYTSVDDYNRTLFCFDTLEGLESPTLHVNPGDKIEITLTNMVPEVPGAPSEAVSGDGTTCGDPVMTLTSVNMHFHGTNTPPTCRSDEVIHTLVNSGQTFTYVIKIPKDEPPGLYWYHPHVHGLSSAAVEGGASGLIEVEGIANLQPAVAGLPERYLVIRDQAVAEVAPPPLGTRAPPLPSWDVSLNYVPVSYPVYKPSIIKMQAGTQEFWRVVNASANTIIDLQVSYDGVAQPLQIVAFDGVVAGSQDGSRQGTIVTQHDILLPPAARAEFIIVAPSAGVKVAKLATLAIDGGPAADSNPARPLARIVATSAPDNLPKAAARTGPPNRQRFESLAAAKVTAKRKLYFSEYFVESRQPPNNRKQKDSEHVNFFITVVGQREKLFDPNNPPAITTTRGAVEEWTIQNRTQEVHEFHIHQIHFLVQAINGVPIPTDQQQFYDTFQVPYWSGVGPYPSIKVKMDFRGPTVGDFVYHCHILEHEDAGMMAIIRVLPRGPARSVRAGEGGAKQASARSTGTKTAPALLAAR